MDRHRLAHAAHAAVHGALALILALEGATAHAVCVLLAALIYAALCRGPGPRRLK